MYPLFQAPLYLTHMFNLFTRSWTMPRYSWGLLFNQCLRQKVHYVDKIRIANQSIILSQVGQYSLERCNWAPLLILQYSRFTEVITSGTQSESSSFVSVESIKVSCFVKVNQINFVKIECLQISLKTLSLGPKMVLSSSTLSIKNL